MVAFETRQTAPDSFEANCRESILRSLQMVEPNWRWVTASTSSGDCALTYRSQRFAAASLIRVEHSVPLMATVRRDEARISVFFVREGGIEVSDRFARRVLSIPAGHIAAISETAGKRLVIQSKSSWLGFQIPEPALRKRFEDLTNRPYVSGFSLAPISACRTDVQGFYDILCQAATDLASASPEVKPKLAAAYQNLALVKLLVQLPNSLAEVVDQGSSLDAPSQLKAAEAFMRNNLLNPVKIEDLADFVGCSPRALQRMFRTYRGASPISVLSSYRLSAAHSEITAGRTRSISDLAKSLQFSNPGRFSVLYKDAYGISPSNALRFTRQPDEEPTD
ncbi:helix-turn-helix transcriptional regulator [Ensifer sp. YR511]|uniref:helix-turn-helix transcriptional regulator n=1 Tax=Ensifer sp. YR511 TaxID=1855294 RepID=UPI00088B44CC|nr:helix-turn-helix transcriptional regulator [Ensifer sp. YR511]SDN73230.1 Helix-turn-helix domain-containing protein [Ensifer sp. YR511]